MTVEKLHNKENSKKDRRIPMRRRNRQELLRKLEVGVERRGGGEKGRGKGEHEEIGWLR